MEGEVQLISQHFEDILREWEIVWVLKTGPSIGSDRISGEGALSTCHVIGLSRSRRIYGKTHSKSESTMDVILTSFADNCTERILCCLVTDSANKQSTPCTT